MLGPAGGRSDRQTFATFGQAGTIRSAPDRTLRTNGWPGPNRRMHKGAKTLDLRDQLVFDALNSCRHAADVRRLGDIIVGPTCQRIECRAAPRSVSVLNMMTGKLRVGLAQSGRVPRPSSSGISMSSVTMSGLICGSLASAIRPLAAVPATSISGSDENVRQQSPDHDRIVDDRRESCRMSAHDSDQAELVDQAVLSERLHQVLVSAVPEPATFDRSRFRS